MKNPKKFLFKITIQKITEKKALKLYFDLIIPGTALLEKLKFKSKDKRNNILYVLKNLEPVFAGLYFYHKVVSKETVFERSIAERKKIRIGRSDEIERKEQKINNQLFKAYLTDYQSPSNVYKKLSKVKGAVNKFQVDSIEKVLSKLTRIIGYAPKDDAFKIEENEKVIDVVEKILQFNNKNQPAQRLKILTSNQILSRLPIS